MGGFKTKLSNRMAGSTRLELATFRVTGGRSNQLNYDPNFLRFSKVSELKKRRPKAQLPARETKISAPYLSKEPLESKAFFKGGNGLLNRRIPSN